MHLFLNGRVWKSYKHLKTEMKTTDVYTCTSSQLTSLSQSHHAFSFSFSTEPRATFIFHLDAQARVSSLSLHLAGKGKTHFSWFITPSWGCFFNPGSQNITTAHQWHLNSLISNLCSTQGTYIQINYENTQPVTSTFILQWIPIAFRMRAKFHSIQNWSLHARHWFTFSVSTVPTLCLPTPSDHSWQTSVTQGTKADCKPGRGSLVSSFLSTAMLTSQTHHHPSHDVSVWPCVHTACTQHIFREA